MFAWLGLSTCALLGLSTFALLGPAWALRPCPDGARTCAPCPTTNFNVRVRGCAHVLMNMQLSATKHTCKSLDANVNVAGHFNGW
eukprot:391798-Alexandrium_andersonii.AAC.1